MKCAADLTTKNLKLNRSIDLADTIDIEDIRSRIFTPKELETVIPVLNGPSLQLIGASKWEQYRLAGDFMPKTILVKGEKTPSLELLKTLNSDPVVIKGDKSQRSEFMEVTPISMVCKELKIMRNSFRKKEINDKKARLDNNIIIQEFMPGQRWLELRGSSEKYQDMLNKAVQTELRMYCFVDRKKEIHSSKRYYATARVFNSDSSDDWACIDQDSVPAKAWKIADVISDRLLVDADIQGGYFAIDLIKSSSSCSGKLGGDIYIREINTRDPMMISPKDNLSEALIQRGLLANVLSVVASQS